MSKIQIDKKYSLYEIALEGLIPGVTSYAAAYKLVKISVPQEDGSTKRVSAPITNKTHIKPTEVLIRPGAKISGKILVEGVELEKFLKIHNLI